jgi:hypothetical protein
MDFSAHGLAQAAQREEKMPEKLPPGATANWHRLKRKVQQGSFS